MPYLFEIPSHKFLAGVKVLTGISDKKILAFSPHSDDLSIGAGGFLAHLSKTNNIKPVLAYTGWRGVKDNNPVAGAIKTREKEMEQETHILGIKEPIFLHLLTYENDNKEDRKKDAIKIKEVIRREKPDIIFLPNEKDIHPRHKLLSFLILSVLKELEISIELFFYEIPWSVFSGEEFNFVVPLSNKLVSKKINAIKVHKSQLARTNFVRLSKALLSLRAGMVPEQKIAGYGESVSLGNWVEVYKHKLLK